MTTIWTVSELIQAFKKLNNDRAGQHVVVPGELKQGVYECYRAGLVKNRRGFAKQLGVSEASMYRWTRGVDLGGRHRRQKKKAAPTTQPAVQGFIECQVVPSVSDTDGNCQVTLRNGVQIQLEAKALTAEFLTRLEAL